MEEVMNKQIQEATQKALELINSGSVELWSAQIGDLTKGQLFKVSIQLSKNGFDSKIIKNSLDNGLVVTKR